MRAVTLLLLALARQHSAREAARRGERGRQVAVPHADHVYTVTLTTTAPAFEEDAADFEQMLSSWRWTD